MTRDEDPVILAEQDVLGSMLLSAKVIPAVFGIVSPGDFYRPAHQVIAEAIARMTQAGTPVDAITVAEELRATKQIGVIGQAPYLHTLLSSVTTSASATYHARIVKEHANRRAIEAIAIRLQHDAQTGADVAALITRAASDLFDLDAPQPDAAGRRARITWASDIEPEAVTWAWEDDGNGRIPAGALTLAAGREGTGKSSFGIWLAARITTGTLPGSWLGRPRPVFYVAVEDSWKHTLVPRLMAAGCDLSKVARFDVTTSTGGEVTISLPADTDLLRDAISEHRAGLVVVDPLMSAVGKGIDTHRERDVREALEPLVKVADDTGAVVLGIAHFNKGGGTDISQLITGSGAFKNVPRAIIGFARDESSDGGTRVMTQSKNSLGRDDLPSLAYVIESDKVEAKGGLIETGLFKFTGPSDRSVADVLGDNRSPDEREEAKDAATWLRSYLTACGGEAAAADVIKDARDSGFSENTIKHARRKVAQSIRDGFGKGSKVVWRLDPDAP